MELFERLSAIQKILTTRKRKMHLNPPIQSAEVSQIEAKYGFTLPEEYRLFITTIGNGGILLPNSDDRNELRAFTDTPELVYTARPFRLTKSKNWSEDDIFSPDTDDPDKIKQANAAFDAVTRNGQLVLTSDSCEGGITWVLIVTGKRRGEVWLQDEDGCLRLPNCTFLDWLKLYLDKKLEDYIMDMTYAEKRKKDRFAAFPAKMKKRINRKVEWNPPISMEEVCAFEARHNITLPEDYKRFITEFANGFKNPDSHSTIIFYSLQELDSLVNLDKPFYFTEMTEEQRLAMEFKLYNAEHPIWTSLFAHIPIESPLSTVWGCPDYSRLHGVLPLAFYAMPDDPALANLSYVLSQPFLILNGPFKGQVWRAKKYTIIVHNQDCYGDFTFTSWIDTILDGVLI